MIRHPEVRAKRASKDERPICGVSLAYYDSLMGAFVYMLRCSDRSFYIGSATGDDLTKRMAEHQSGAFVGYTATRRPVHLVWSQHFDRITDAIAAERQIKGWSRAKKEALMKEDWTSLQFKSKCRGGKPKSNPSS